MPAFSGPSYPYGRGDVHVVVSCLDLDTLVALIATSSWIERNSVMTALRNPVETGLPGSSPAMSVDVPYPKRQFVIFGFSLHWLVAFFIISLFSAFAFKGVLGVEV